MKWLKSVIETIANEAPDEKVSRRRPSMKRIWEEEQRQKREHLQAQWEDAKNRSRDFLGLIAAGMADRGLQLSPLRVVQEGSESAPLILAQSYGSVCLQLSIRPIASTPYSFTILNENADHQALCFDLPHRFHYLHPAKKYGARRMQCLLEHLECILLASSVGGHPSAGYWRRQHRAMIVETMQLFSRRGYGSVSLHEGRASRLSADCQVKQNKISMVTDEDVNVPWVYLKLGFQTANRNKFDPYEREIPVPLDYDFRDRNPSEILLTLTHMLFESAIAQRRKSDWVRSEDAPPSGFAL